MRLIKILPNIVTCRNVRDEVKIGWMRREQKARLGKLHARERFQIYNFFSFPTLALSLLAIHRATLNLPNVQFSSSLEYNQNVEIPRKNHFCTPFLVDFCQEILLWSVSAVY